MPFPEDDDNFRRFAEGEAPLFVDFPLVSNSNVELVPRGLDRSVIGDALRALELDEIDGKGTGGS